MLDKGCELKVLAINFEVKCFNSEKTKLRKHRYHEITSKAVQYKVGVVWESNDKV